MESHVSKEMDREDARVKQLAPCTLLALSKPNEAAPQVTEDVLFELLPALLETAAAHHACDPLPKQAYCDVACAALSASSLLNAPPGFLEFLLCSPWHQMDLYHRGLGSKSALGSISITTEQRQHVINTPLPDHLIPVLLAFVYDKANELSLPPLLVRTHDDLGAELAPPSPSGALDCETGTPPLKARRRTVTPVTSEVDHLLYCHADPTVASAAGLLPLELVPLCGDRDSALSRICRCMHSADASTWECRSRGARELLMQALLRSFSGGARAWAARSFKVGRCWLGLWGMSASLWRPALDTYLAARSQRDVAAQRVSFLADVAHVRELAAKGRAALRAASSGLSTALVEHADSFVGDLDDAECLDLPQSWPQPGAVRCWAVLKEWPESAQTHAQAMDAAAVALESFAGAAKTLEKLRAAGLASRVKQDTCSQGDCIEAAPSSQMGSHNLLSKTELGLLMSFSEQAELYRAWAEAATVKLRLCACAGCAAVATTTVATCHHACGGLFAAVAGAHAQTAKWRSERQGTGEALCAALLQHVHLFLALHAQAGTSKGRIATAEMCLARWDELRQGGIDLTSGTAEHERDQIALLRKWLNAAKADVALVETLNGAPISRQQTLWQVLKRSNADSVAAHLSPRNGTARSPNVSSAFLHNMQAALESAVDASPHLKGICEAIVRAAAHRVELLDRLKLLQAIDAQDSQLEVKLESLDTVIAELEGQDGMQADVEVACGVRSKLQQRLSMQRSLEATMTYVRALPSAAEVTDALLLDIDWHARRVCLETATAAADGKVNTHRAKRLRRELEGYETAAAATRALTSTLEKTMCSAAALRSALYKVEEAVAALSSAASALLPATVGLNADLIARARQRLEVERAAETLAREVRAAKGVEQLPRLEAACLAAKQVKAETHFPETYVAASELRERLSTAFKLKATLDAATKVLNRSQKKEDAAALEAAISRASSATDSADLLSDTLRIAQQKLDFWQTQTTSEAKLDKALSEGAPVPQLARAVQEASGVGVKVLAAKRTLKVLQSVEAAVEKVTGAAASGQRSLLATRIAAAEAAGVEHPLVRTASVHLRRVVLSEAAGGLESARNHLHSSVSINVQHAMLRAAIEAAEDALAEPSTRQYLGVARARACATDLAILGGQGGPPDTRETLVASPRAREQKMFERAAARSDELASPRDASGARTTDADASALPVCADGSVIDEPAQATVAVQDIDSDEAERLAGGVDNAAMAALARQADTLLLGLNRALVDMQAVDAHLKQIERDKAESMRQRREAHERKQQARRDAERVARARAEAERRGDRSTARSKKVAPSGGVTGHSARLAPLDVTAVAADAAPASSVGSTCSTPAPSAPTRADMLSDSASVRGDEAPRRAASAKLHNRGWTSLMPAEGSPLRPATPQDAAPHFAVASPSHVLSSSTAAIDRSRVQAYSGPSTAAHHAEAASRLAALAAGTQSAAAAPPSQLSASILASPFATQSAAPTPWQHTEAGRARRASFADTLASSTQPGTQWQYHHAGRGAAPANLLEWAEHATRAASGRLDSGRLASSTLSPHAAAFARNAQPAGYGSAGLHGAAARWGQDTSAAAAAADSLYRADDARHTPYSQSIWSAQRTDSGRDATWRRDSLGVGAGTLGQAVAPDPEPVAAPAFGLFAYGAPGANVFAGESEWAASPQARAQQVAAADASVHTERTVEPRAQLEAPSFGSADFRGLSGLVRDESWSGVQIALGQHLARPLSAQLGREQMSAVPHQQLQYDSAHGQYLPGFGGDELVDARYGGEGLHVFDNWGHSNAAVHASGSAYGDGDVVAAGHLTGARVVPRQALNVHAAEFQARKPRTSSKDLGLPNDLIE